MLLNLLASINLCVVFTSVCLNPIAQRNGETSTKATAVLMAGPHGRGTYFMMMEPAKNPISTTAMMMAE